MFWLPVNKLEHLDEPNTQGDDGWNNEEMHASVAKYGVIQPVTVAKSKHEIEHNNNHTVYVWNGNHRLKAAKEHGITHLRCTHHTGSEDAHNLTKDDVHALGGSEKTPETMDLTPRELWLLIRALEEQRRRWKDDGDAYYADALLKRLREEQRTARVEREEREWR